MRDYPIPQKPLRFSRKQRSLLDHVLRHVVYGRDERWHQVLPSDLIDGARDELTERETVSLETPSCIALCTAYLAYCESLVATAANEEQNIAYAREMAPERPTRIQRWKAQAWCREDKTYAGAQSYVEADGPKPYLLTTCMRLASRRCRGHALDRLIAERLRNHCAAHGARIDTIHDPKIAALMAQSTPGVQ